MKTKSILAVFLCLLMLCSLFLTACNKNDDSQKATEDSTATTTVATEDEAVQTATENTEASANETDTETVTATTAPTTTADKTTVAPTKAPVKNDNSSGSSNAGPVDSKPMTCTVTVNEKDYTAEYGDILTYTCYLKTPKMIENVQASINYTPNCLQLLDDKIETQLPVVHSGAIINTENAGVVNYNAINITGFDFREEGVLITLRFKVIFGGSGAIVNAIEFMDEKGAEVAYVDNFKMSDKIKIRETLK